MSNDTATLPPITFSSLKTWLASEPLLKAVDISRIWATDLPRWESEAKKHPNTIFYIGLCDENRHDLLKMQARIEGKKINANTYIVQEREDQHVDPILLFREHYTSLPPRVSKATLVKKLTTDGGGSLECCTCYDSFVPSRVAPMEDVLRSVTMPKVEKTNAFKQFFDRKIGHFHCLLCDSHCCINCKLEMSPMRFKDEAQLHIELKTRCPVCRNETTETHLNSIIGARMLLQEGKDVDVVLMTVAKHWGLV